MFLIKGAKRSFNGDWIWGGCALIPVNGIPWQPVYATYHWWKKAGTTDGLTDGLSDGGIDGRKDTPTFWGWMRMYRKRTNTYFWTIKNDGINQMNFSMALGPFLGYSFRTLWMKLACSTNNSTKNFISDPFKFSFQVGAVGAHTEEEEEVTRNSLTLANSAWSKP